MSIGKQFLEEKVQGMFESEEGSLVESWINGNKSFVARELKGAMGAKFESLAQEIVTHLVKEKDVSGLKFLLTQIANK